MTESDNPPSPNWHLTILVPFRDEARRLILTAAKTLTPDIPGMDVFSTVAARASDETLDHYTERITDAYLARNPLSEAEIAELWRVVRDALADVADIDRRETPKVE